MSQVKNRFFKYTNDLKEDPYRDRIIESFSKLHKEKETQGNIGYLGRLKYKQFLGYLSLSAQKDFINENNPIKITSLDNECMEVFTYGHSLIKKINNMCLYPLYEILPGAAKITDPYWEIDPNDQLSQEVTISNAQFDKFIQSYQLSKPYKIIKEKLSRLPKLKGLKDKDLAAGIYNLKNKIKLSGLKNSPEELFDIGLRINMNKPDSILYSIFYSLLYIHSSLESIDQIIFQALLHEKFISINEDNIFDISYSGSNSISNIYEITGSFPVFFCSEILHIEIPWRKEFKKDLCIVESVNMSFTQEFGDETKIGLRGTDENLSYYSNLINNIHI